MVSAEKAAGSFVLEVHDIRLQNRQHAPRSDRENGPVKKARTLLRLASSVKTSIISSSPGTPCSDPPEQEATLRGIDSRTDRWVSMEMEPIVIYRQSWYTDPSNIDENDIHGIMISINFENQTDVEDLYDFMGLKISDSPARLSTSYGNIFDVPRERTSLPLRASGNQLGIELEVSMYWYPLKRDSVLTSYNRHLRNTIEPTSSYPTPPLDMEPRYKLTFVYGNGSLERSELVCPHCSKRKTTGIEDLKMHLISWHEYFDYQVTLERVDEHGVEHWRFESEVANYRAGQRASDTADEPFDVRVLAPARPFDRRRYLAGDDEFERLAKMGKPTRNAKTKLATNCSKVAPGPRPRKAPDQVQFRPRREKKTFVVPKAPKGITFFRSISKRPLQPGEVISESDDELDEGWMYRRKHAEIDKAGLPEASRRFLKVFDDFMHEENLQADMHAGDSIIRFARERGVQIWRDDIMFEFTKKLNELLNEDVISIEVYGKALETVGQQKINVREDNELSQRLVELDVQHQETPLGPAGNGANNRPGKEIGFNPEHQTYSSLNQADGIFNSVYGTNKDLTSKNDRKGKDKAIVAETGYLTPINGDLDGDVNMSEVSLEMPAESLYTPQNEDEDADPPYDLCYCGADASTAPGTSGIIACNNTDCIRRIFHRACIQQHTKTPIPILAQKTRVWTCEGCKHDSNTTG
ncbi:uncharacterized protein ALTATR162_LOCUS3522 [Alternaria atra]|uniref:Polycomb protein VEFS-Box domain-containing protein n=1 Tax=Alternaria atra TaxID=119953 RepID=A0A8J2MYF0_9PLEO|nr:uncharacterized protein ALTATR162_LOCUS3522 [Alternaria atra]CAG5154230.1 unnamed protein product [Alternaria atra]